MLAETYAVPTWETWLFIILIVGFLWAGLRWLDRASRDEVNRHVDAALGTLKVERSETWRQTYLRKPEWWDDPTEPRCDHCGVHCEDAHAWCGVCGNCQPHCECIPADLVDDLNNIVAFMQDSGDDHAFAMRNGSHFVIVGSNDTATCSCGWVGDFAGAQEHTL